MIVSSNFIYRLFIFSIILTSAPFSMAQNLDCEPDSTFLETLPFGEDLSFCSKWNPDFVFNGHHCCLRKPKLKGSRCSPRRAKVVFCDDMTADQKKYLELAKTGIPRDILEIIHQELLNKSSQTACGVNHGFLVRGRPVIPSLQNKIQFRAPEKCTFFGTDAMVGLLEWLGREVGQNYNGEKYGGAHLLVGDISAPRGGCLSGRGGRRGHRSHTTGQDLDLGFLVAKEGQRSPGSFNQSFDAKTNWWLLKKLFQNPYVCIQVIFLDRKWIQKLAHIAKGEPEWGMYRKFLKHVRGHQNHLHVRIGEHPGEPGCLADPALIEEEEESEELGSF